MVHHHLATLVVVLSSVACLLALLTYCSMPAYVWSRVFEAPEKQIPIRLGCWAGFGGYFDAVLYGDVHLGIVPAIHTPNMFSW